MTNSKLQKHIYCYFKKNNFVYNWNFTFFHITATSASPRASSTSPGRGGGLEHQRQSQQQVQSQQSGATPVQRIDQFETRNYVYDFVILIIAIVIGLLLYRRFTISMDVPTSPPDTAPEPGDLPWKKWLLSLFWLFW